MPENTVATLKEMQFKQNEYPFHPTKPASYLAKSEPTNWIHFSFYIWDSMHITHNFTSCEWVYKKRRNDFIKIWNKEQSNIAST